VTSTAASRPTPAHRPLPGSAERPAKGRQARGRLDLGPCSRALALDGLLCAGEAAALVGLLTGAGIAFALTSGTAAGDTAAAALTHAGANLPGDARYRPPGHVVRSVSAWCRPRPVGPHLGPMAEGDTVPVLLDEARERGFRPRTLGADKS